MSDIERMTVALPAEMADTIRAAIEAGEYASTSDVVHDALRLWEDRRKVRAQSLVALKTAWDEGKASGVAGPLDMDKIVRNAKQRARAARGG